MKFIINTSLEGSVTSENLLKIKQHLSISIDKGNDIEVCCKKVDKVDLAGFNALLVVHMSAMRSNKSLKYINCTEPKLIDFISQTQFDHVFITLQATA